MVVAVLVTVVVVAVLVAVVVVAVVVDHGSTVVYPWCILQDIFFRDCYKRMFFSSGLI